MDKHETASILIDMQYRHTVLIYEKVHVQEEVLADGDDSSRPKKDAFAVLMEAKSSKRVLPRRKVSSSGMASGSGISNLDICFCMYVVYFVFWYVKHRLKKKKISTYLPYFFSMSRQSNNFF